MRNERTITNSNEPDALTCEDHLIRLLPLFNTALFTGINTAAASIGYAFMNHINPRFAPFSESDALKNAALSTAMGFIILTVGCALFSKPSTKKNPRDRLSETANIFYPLACTDMVLAFPLSIFTAYFIYQLSLLDATMIGMSTAIGVNMILIPTLVAAALFQLGNHLKPTETTSDNEAFEASIRPIVRHELGTEPAIDSPHHTIIHVRSASEHVPDVLSMHP